MRCFRRDGYRAPWRCSAEETSAIRRSRALLARSPGPRAVAVIPTAAAFEHPEEVVVRVAEWLIPHGAHVEALMATSRTDADLEDLADRLADA